MFNSIKNYGILAKAIQKKIINLFFFNLRNFSKNKKIDDRPYGGGPGMIISFSPLKKAIIKAKKNNKYLVIYLSPQGKKITYKKLKKLSEKKCLILICGRYQGIDQRIIDKYIDKEISIGDYILTGGELAAMVLIDGISRFVPGVIKNKTEKHEDSFSNVFLDYPHYTRPKKIDGMSVPKILLSGNHKKIELWRLKKSIQQTLLKKPKILKKNNLIKKISLKNYKKITLIQNQKKKNKKNE